MTTITIINANAARIPLPDQSVHAVVTSPPYYGLRDYGNLPLVWPNGHTPCAVGEHVWGDQLVTHQRGTAGTRSTLDSNQSRGRQQSASQGNFCQRCGAWRGSLGLEPTPQLYVDHLVAIFREVWRVLRDDGVCFLNLGDSYANDEKWGGYTGGKHVKELHGKSVGRTKRDTGLKSKDLMLIPARVALALQADGWYLRNEIIWAKAVSFNSLGYSGTTMPESVTDRFTRAHETIWLLSKQPRYYMDMDAIKEQSIDPDDDRKARGKDDQKRMPTEMIAGMRPGSATYSTRNPRDVITINPHPYKGAHFAAWPPALVEVMVKPATSAKGACPSCGAPWVRVVEHTATVDPSAKGSRFDTGKTAVNGAGRVQSGERYTKQYAGWIPGCACYPDVPAAPDLPEQPDDAQSPEPCPACNGSGLVPDLPMFGAEPCLKCLGTGGTSANDAYTQWQAAYAAAQQQRQAILHQIEALNLPVVPCTVLDPFAGSGTTGQKCAELGRNFIGLDLNHHYLSDLATVRTSNVQTSMQF